MRKCAFLFIVILASCSTHKSNDSVTEVLNSTIKQFSAENKCKIELQYEVSSAVKLKISSSDSLLSSRLLLAVFNKTKYHTNIKKYVVSDNKGKNVLVLSSMDLLKIIRKQAKFERLIGSLSEGDYGSFCYSFYPDYRKVIKSEDLKGMMGGVDWNSMRFKGFIIHHYNNGTYIDFLSSGRSHSLYISFDLEDSRDFVFGINLS